MGRCTMYNSCTIVQLLVFFSYPTVLVLGIIKKLSYDVYQILSHRSLLAFEVNNDYLFSSKSYLKFCFSFSRMIFVVTGPALA